MPFEGQTQCVPPLPVATTTLLTSAMLHPSEQFLLDLTSKTGYGTILNVPVRNGRVILDPAPLVEQTFRMGSPDDTHQFVGCVMDYQLKKPQVDLINRVRSMTHRSITIAVQNGLPVNVKAAGRFQ